MRATKVKCDLAGADPPAAGSSTNFFLEVIEHLPVPGHIPLASLHSILRPKGLLLCSTPNLYRLRNIAYLMPGQQLFIISVSRRTGCGHVLEYSSEYLAWQFQRVVWQFQRAGFRNFNVQLCLAHTAEPVPGTGCSPCWVHRSAGFRAAATT